MKKSFILFFIIVALVAVGFSQGIAQDEQSAAQGNMFALRKLIRETPDQKAKILAMAKEVLGQTNNTRMALSQHSQIAQMLLDAGIYLDDAEKIAVQGKSFLQLEKFIEASKEVFKQNNAQMISDEALTLEFNTYKARLLSILGRIEAKLGKTDSAEKTLKESNKLNPIDIPTALALSEIIEKKGDSKAAFNFLVPASFSVGVTINLTERLEKLYQKNNGGKLDGLSEYLDKKYHEAFPFKPTAYQPTAKRSNRTVLAELYTGAGCSPCVIADLAYDGILQRYQRQDVTVLIYHVHNPRPDPLANEETTLRSAFYGIRGVPGVAFDGDFIGQSIGGADWEKSKLRYDEWTAKIDKALETQVDAELKLSAVKDGSNVKVKVSADKFQTPSQNLKLHIILAEDLVRYVGENGIRFHPFVVRSMATSDARGLVIDATKANSFEHTFDVAKISENLRIYLDEFEKNPPKEFKYGEAKFRQKLYAIDEKNLSVVAFIQDEKTKKVLQTVYLKVK